MNNIVILDPAERALKEATDRFDTIQAQLNKIEAEIALLVHIKKSLEENMHALKDRQTVPVLIEYGKAKVDLDRVCHNLAMTKINRNNTENSLAKANKHLNECKQKYLASLESKRSIVIKVNFGRSDD